MEVFKTKDPNTVKVLIELMDKYFKKEEIDDYRPEHLLKWLRHNIGNPLIGVWVAINGEGANGFCIAMMQPGLDKEYVVVSHIYADVEEIESQFLHEVESWSNKYGITDVKAVTKHPKRWKDYGFVVSEHVLKREL